MESRRGGGARSRGRVREQQVREGGRAAGHRREVRRKTVSGVKDRDGFLRGATTGK